MKMDRLDLKTPDFTDQNITKLAALFPNCVTESKDENGVLQRAIDFDLLKQELSKHIVEGAKERYRLEWPGKREALLTANTPIDKTLRPTREESVDFDTTKNLYIEGDNLEALKLLQEAYLGKVKMIYIDPPYNTGKDFVYKDNFTRGRDEELQESGQVDEEGNRLVQNLESNGRFHSDWLSMMYPRLRLARNLLKDDGVIFISIDDNEVHNLRKICDEVFGEGNFVGTIIRKTKLTSNKGTFLSSSHEYILVYSRDINKTNKFNDTEAQESESYTKLFKYEDERGKYNEVSLYMPSLPNAEQRPNSRYDITCPDGSIVYPPNNKIFRWKKDTFLKNLNEGRIVFKRTKTSPLVDEHGNKAKWNIYTKLYLHERKESGLLPSSLIDKYPNSEASKELIKLKIPFDFSKPRKLLQYLMKIMQTSGNDIILDLFSGSATTAHAVMQLNAEDGGNRRFIMVQLPEKTDEKSEAYKAGCKTIAEIGKERIRRAGKKIKEENKDKEHIENLDIGFRVLKVDSSNFKYIYFTPDAIDKSILPQFIDHIKEERTSEDLLFGVLVDWGVDLSLPIRSESIEGKRVYFVGHGDLAACFEEEIDENFVKTLAKRLAEEDVLRVVFKESGFADDNIKINTEQDFKQLAPSVEVRVI